MDVDSKLIGPGSIRPGRFVASLLRGLPWLEIGLLGLLAVAGVGLAFASVHWSFLVAVLIMAVIAGGLVMINRPEIGLLAVVFAIPLEDFNQVFAAGTLSVIKLLSLGLFAAYLAHYMIVGQGEKLVNVPQNVYIALFILAVLISDLVAIDPAYAVSKTFKFARMVSFYFLVINIVRSRSTLHRVLWVMIVAGFLSSVYGLYHYYFTPEVLEPDMRVSGTLDDPMGFSYAMVILLPLIWYMLTHRSSFAVRIFLVLAGLTLLYAILLSGTRSGVMAALGVLVLIALRRKHPLVNITLVALLIVAGLILMPDDVKRRMGLSSEIDKTAQASTERRETYYTFGLQLFLDNPIVGTGLGGFAEAYSHSDYRFMRSEDDVRRIAHNMYLEIAIGTGLLGLIPFLLLFFVTLANLQRVLSYSQLGALSDLAKMVQISLSAFLFTGLFSSSQYDKPLWLLTGLASVIPILARQSTIGVSDGERCTIGRM